MYRCAENRKKLRRPCTIRLPQDEFTGSRRGSHDGRWFPHRHFMSVYMMQICVFLVVFVDILFPCRNK